MSATSSIKAALAVSALVGAYASTEPAPESLSSWDCAQACWDDFTSIPCYVCLDQINVGNQIEVSALTDLIQFKLGVAYTEGWCRTNKLHEEEGVDIEKYPTGWMPVEGQPGKFTGCEKKTDFPGLGSTSHMNHTYVKETMKKVVAWQENGEVWRGNELGFIISNELFWGKVEPASVLLGATPKQHKVFRPIMDRLFNSCDEECTKRLEASARKLVQKPSLRVQEDIVIWVHENLFATMFPGSENPIDVEEFVGTQASFTSLSTITQLLPDWISNILAGSTIDEINTMFDDLRPLVEFHYGAEVGGMDCAPSNNCIDQLTSAFLDTLLAAGGLSVPSAISTGLWVLHGDTEGYDDKFPQNIRINNADPMPFFYESMRFFAPVVGFPYWTTFPDRAYSEEGNQYTNGRREILNLALANKDPNVFGADAHKFRVRDIADYHRDFVGFADFAEDNTVAGGKMNRKCPGKGMALAMGKAFFKNWDQDEWKTFDNPQFTEAVPFVDNFLLEKPAMKNFVDYVWDEVLSQGFLPLDGRFDEYTRLQSLLNGFEVTSWSNPTAADVLPPVEDLPAIKVPCGFADEVFVAKDDEGWDDVSDMEAFIFSGIGSNLGFPDKASECGEWKDGEDRQAALEDMLYAPLSPKRNLVPWTNQDQYTNEGLEDLVFHGIGQHRIQRVRADDPHKENAVYAVYLGFMSDLQVKEGFARYGADAYFTAQGTVTHIRRHGVTYYPTNNEPLMGYGYTSSGYVPRWDTRANGWEAYTANDDYMSKSRCETFGGRRDCPWYDLAGWWNNCDCHVPNRVGWKQAKMGFLGSLNAAITSIDHLYGLHLIVGNSIVTAGRDELGVDHPLRRLMHPFSFRTAAINFKASFALTNEGGLLSRALPLTDLGLQQLFDFAHSEASPLSWETIPERHARQNVDFPLSLHEDGADFFGVIKTYVHAYLASYYEYSGNACGADNEVAAWWANVASQAPRSTSLEELTCENLEDVLSTFIYYVTAGHTHVGALVAEVEDPCHMPWAWREGELCGTPRTAYTQHLTFALTSVEQPKLMDDYSHLFNDQVGKDLWEQFQAELADFGARVDSRNAGRYRAFKSFDMRYVEVSVAI